jgi:uncharacterized membrane protein YkvA (DUF1232 family)
MYKEYVTELLQAIKARNLPTSVKLMLGAAIAYFILPVDFIPDIGLPVGLVDDTVIAAILIGLGGRIIYNNAKAEQEKNQNVDDNVIDI